MLFFDQINFDNPRKKIAELNLFDEGEMKLLDSLGELIKNKGMYHSSKMSK